MSFESIFVAGCVITILVFYILWLYLSQSAKPAQQISQPRSQAAFDACNHKHVSTKVISDTWGTIGICKNCFWPMRLVIGEDWWPMGWKDGWTRVKGEVFIASIFSMKNKADIEGTLALFDNIISEGQSVFLKGDHDKILS